MKTFQSHKLNARFALLAVAMLVSSCSLKSQGTASVSVKVPAKPASAMIAAGSMNVSTVGSDFSFPPPMSLAEVNCLVVDVIAEDIAPAPWDVQDSHISYVEHVKKALEGEPCGYAGAMSKVVPFSSASSLMVNVPMGKKRIFQLLGFKAPAGSCDQPTDPQDFFSKMGSGKVSPNELGRLIVDVNGSMSINLVGKFDPLRNADHCSLESQSHQGPEWFFDSFHKVASGAPIRSATWLDKKYFIFQNTSNDLVVLKADSTGTFPVTNIGVNGPYAFSYDIAVNSSGNPVVLYTSSPTTTWIKEFNGTTWVALGGSLGGTTMQCRLAGSGIGTYFAACYDSGQINAWFYAGTWTALTGGPIPSVSSNSFDLEFDPMTGYARVAYFSSGFIYVKLLGTSSIGGSYYQLPASTPDSINLVLKPDSLPILAYRDSANPSTVSVFDCVDLCDASGDWIDRSITTTHVPGMTDRREIKLSMNSLWEPVIFFYGYNAAYWKAFMFKLDISTMFWEKQMNEDWLTPADSANGDPWFFNSNSIGFAIDENTNRIYSLISKPGYGTAYMNFSQQ